MEMWCAARHCAFESHPLRHNKSKSEIPFSGIVLLDFFCFSSNNRVISPEKTIVGIRNMNTFSIFLYNYYYLYFNLRQKRGFQRNESLSFVMEDMKKSYTQASPNSLPERGMELFRLLSNISENSSVHI